MTWYVPLKENKSRSHGETRTPNLQFRRKNIKVSKKKIKKNLAILLNVERPFLSRLTMY